MQAMSQADLPHPEIPAAQDPIEQWPQHRHTRRKRRRFSRRKTKKVVRITVIVVLHIIIIAFLIYIWTKIAYSSAKAHTLQNENIAAATCPGNTLRSDNTSPEERVASIDGKSC